LVFFAFKANPITLAHLNVTIASVLREAIRYYAQGEKLNIMDVVNVSKEDPMRKPEVGNTYKPRLFFAENVIRDVFGSIIQTLPEDERLGGFINYLKTDPELSEFVKTETVDGESQDKVFDRFNGEENLHRLIRIFHTIKLKMFGYPVGGDHLRVLAKKARESISIKELEKQLVPTGFSVNALIEKGYFEAIPGNRDRLKYNRKKIEKDIKNEDKLVPDDLVEALKVLL
jgi:hypothetical protein